MRFNSIQRGRGASGSEAKGGARIMRVFVRHCHIRRSEPARLKDLELVGLEEAQFYIMATSRILHPVTAGCLPWASRPTT